MEVKLTDGYQQRFTSACLAQIGSRKEVTKIEDGNEGWKDHADRSGQHTDGDHKILEEPYFNLSGETQYKVCTKCGKKLDERFIPNFDGS